MSNIVNNTIDIKDCIEWCDNMTKEGKEVTMTWDGGNDSGWVQFLVDGVDVDNEFTTKLIDLMHNTLDYGSWAGEFQSTGSAKYNSENKCFEGIDIYSTTESAESTVNIFLHISENLWFDSIDIHIEKEHDDLSNVSIEFRIQNGFLTADHEKEITYLEKYVQDAIEKEVENWVRSSGETFTGIFENQTIDYNQFVKNEDKLEYKITELSFNYEDEEEKSIVLDLNTI